MIHFHLALFLVMICAFGVTNHGTSILSPLPLWNRCQTWPCRAQWRASALYVIVASHAVPLRTHLNQMDKYEKFLPHFLIIYQNQLILPYMTGNHHGFLHYVAFGVSTLQENMQGKDALCQSRHGICTTTMSHVAAIPERFILTTWIISG